ncbi:MAG: acylphosphatase [Planctomycetota bacterium]
MIRETVFYSGRVQGVGFRHTTAGLAKEAAVAGYVQNLPDGRVKLVAEGKDADVQAFVDAVQETLGQHIDKIDSSRSVGTGEFGVGEAYVADGAFRVRL